MVSAYLHRKHRTLKYMTPFDADKPENHSKVMAAHLQYYSKIASKRKLPKHKIGDVVRINRDPFDKFKRSYKMQFMPEQFKIIEILTRLPIPMYKIQSLDNDEIIESAYYAEELQPIRGDSYKVHVLERRINKGKLQLYVQWFGFGPEWNEWIDAKSAVQNGVEFLDTGLAE